MNPDFVKYSDTYARYWFRYLGYDFQDTERGRLLTKGQFSNLFPEICANLSEGRELPARFRLVEREKAKKSVERHGKIYEIESKVV